MLIPFQMDMDPLVKSQTSRNKPLRLPIVEIERSFIKIILLTAKLENLNFVSVCMHIKTSIRVGVPLSLE